LENQASNCDARIRAYKNGKTMEQCRQEARKTTELLSEEISERGGFMEKSIRSNRL